MRHALRVARPFRLLAAAWLWSAKTTHFHGNGCASLCRPFLGRRTRLFLVVGLLPCYRRAGCFGDFSTENTVMQTDGPSLPPSIDLYQHRDARCGACWPPRQPDWWWTWIARALHRQRQLIHGRGDSARHVLGSTAGRLTAAAGEGVFMSSDSGDLCFARRK